MAPLSPYGGTHVLDSVENANDAIFEFLGNAKSRLSVYSDSMGPSVSVGVELYNRAIIDLKNRGIKVKYVTEINKENIHYCKDLMKMIDELRHLDGVKGNSAVSETEYLFVAAALQEAKPVQQLLYCDMKTIVEQQQYIFDTIWSKAIPAEQKIKEIEEGIEPEYFEVFTSRDRERVSQILFDLSESVKKEALILLPNAKAMIRLDRLDAIDHIINASLAGATVKIICPLSEENSRITRKIHEQAPAVRILNGDASSYGMYIVDGEKFVKAELKEPEAETFSEAIGFGVYSNSKLSVNSVRSIFELLWNEHTTNEELKRADKMQKQFINITAHELRTPIQPLLALLRLLRSTKTAIRKEELDQSLDLMIRNAMRLKQLSEDILDVTIIESQSLNLRKEVCDLNDIVRSSIDEYNTNQVTQSKKDIDIKYTPSYGKVFVEVDRSRIAQVISNLLNNAFKFTREGTILVNIELNQRTKEATVSVKDSGEGIDPEVVPRLFEKFASKSFQGTGLGLFISKGIVEGHGGRVWAENNAYGKGATFYFTLPYL
jgi:two-component system sensor histidine kinase VicK